MLVINVKYLRSYNFLKNQFKLFYTFYWYLSHLLPHFFRETFLRQKILKSFKYGASKNKFKSLSCLLLITKLGNKKSYFLLYFFMIKMKRVAV